MGNKLDFAKKEVVSQINAPDHLVATLGRGGNEILSKINGRILILIIRVKNSLLILHSSAREGEREG